ncbi:MAG TPA: MarR family transcriptional regulator [Ardenticatenaceae bacterium]|nr:MarR family transcriptional regulator [Ardenticatenaceae bacterium]
MNEQEAAARIIEIVPYLSRVVAAEARHELDEDRGLLTLTHLRVLGRARRHPGCSLGDMARAREVSLPTMSKMISGLVDKGLLTRQQDPENRRLVRIALTPEGEQLYLDILSRVQRRIAELLAGLAPGHRHSIVQALETLAELFAAEGEVRQHLPLPVDTEDDS